MSQVETLSCRRALSSRERVLHVAHAYTRPHMEWIVALGRVSGSVISMTTECAPGRPCNLSVTDPFVSPLSTASFRDLDADAESESAARRGVFRGGDPDHVGAPVWLFTVSDGRNWEKADEGGSDNKV